MLIQGRVSPRSDCDTPGVYGGLIKSVKADVGGRPASVEALRAVVARFDELKNRDSRFQDKHLAMALGVSAPAVTGWRKLLEKEEPARGPNVATLEAIASLPDPGVLWGLERALHEMRGTVEDLEAALDVRRALQDAAATPSAGREARDLARTLADERGPQRPADIPEKKQQAGGTKRDE